MYKHKISMRVILFHFAIISLEHRPINLSQSLHVQDDFFNFQFTFSITFSAGKTGLSGVYSHG